MTQHDAYVELYKGCLVPHDARSDHGKRHKLSEVLFMTVVGLLAGAQNAEDLARFGRAQLEWLRQFLVLEHGVPSHDTFLSVLSLIRPEEIEALVRCWTCALREPGALTVEGGHVAFDGQALRGSADRGAGTTAVHLVSAYLTGLGVTLGTEKVDDKSNEIKAIPNLIRSLDLQGSTVTIDAMGCQKAIALALRQAGADYALQVKDNQPTLLADIKAAAAELVRRRRPGEARAEMLRFRDVDKGHGRIETRVCVVSHDVSGIQSRADWADLAGFVVMIRERHDVLSGKESKEASYFIISNGAATAAELSAVIRNHWAIENELHWSLDVVWGSDGHKVRDRRAAENLGRLRRFCAGMIKQSAGWGMSGRGLRMMCGWTPDTILRVLAGEVVSVERKRRPNRKVVGRFGQGLRKRQPAAAKK
jgi:predicted transposase YbfD/YdcC